MSLHALAGHMAAKGRGSDSMLVHMTPEEVQSLQVLALRAGGTLTINPETGLPEANFLKKMLPMIAGFALAPLTAGTSLAFLGATPLASALTVGGITGLATGSLSRGLMAGLGAYGGASLGAGLASAGEASLAASGTPIAENVAGAAIPPVEQLNPSNFGFSAADKLSAGAKAAFTDPKSVVTALGGPAKAIGTTFAAASPLMAADTVETTTPRPDTGYIRQKKFNPYTQQFIDLEPVKASEWGSRRFSDFADGGIVALAAGGDYRSLTKDSSAADIASAYKQFTTAGGGDTEANRAAAIDYLTNLGIGQDRIGQAYTQFQAAPTYTDYTQQNVADYLRANPNIDIAAETARLNANPLLVNQTISQMGLGFLDPTQTARGSGTLQYADAFGNAGIDANELFAANLALDPNYSFAGKRGAEGIGALQRAFDVAGTVKGFNPAGADQSAKDIEWVKMMDTKGYNATDIARATGLSIGEVQAREAAARKAMQPKIVTQPPIVTTLPDNITQITDTLPGGVSGGGNTVVNANGTVTTAPNIPGRPVGGFTGMGQVRDVYTQGGGSLGQSNLFVPKTLDEMYARYGNTGGSQQAYDYLMGKGAADIKKPVTRSGELMLPYTEAVLGQEVAAASGPATQKYIFDRRTRRYILNPAYTAAQEAAKKETTKTTDANAQVDVAANGGVMRMALGGLGALAGGGSASQYNLGSYSDGGRLLRGPGDGVSDSIPATIGDKQPARLADGEFVVPARIVSELGNGSTEAGARKLYAMMDRVQKARGKTTGKNRVAANTRADKYLPA